jgi:hypothetical protein
MPDIGNLYLPKQTIEVPQDNDAVLVFDYQDQDGTLLDLTGVLEIEFVIFTAIGGTAEVTKTYTGGDIVIFGNDYQFSVPITSTDTQSLTNRVSYHECRITNSDGDKRTVSAGAFRCERTYIWSIP